MVEYRPRWAQHVRGEYTEREFDAETNQYAEQTYKVTCETCGESWGPAKCLSGKVRNHIAMFATHHLHRNPLMDPIPPKR